MAFWGNLFSSDMAIDLGTANTLVYVKGRGRYPERTIRGGLPGQGRREKRRWPSGEDAKLMLGRTPGVDPRRSGR